MELADLIRERRKSLAMTQDQFAKLIGVSTQSVVWWESGKYIPSPDKLAKMGIQTHYRIP